MVAPQLSRTKQGYQGSLSVYQLLEHIVGIFEQQSEYISRNYHVHRSFLQEHLNLADKVVKKAVLIEYRVNQIWWNRSYASKFGYSLNWERNVSSAVGHNAGLKLRATFGTTEIFGMLYAIKLELLDLKCKYSDLAAAIASHKPTYSYPTFQPDATPAKNPYKVLGISEDATKEQIKKRYHQIVLKIHPDKNLGDPKATTRFQRLNHAYKELVG